MKYITRALEGTFNRLAAEFPAILITGPRQVVDTPTPAPEDMGFFGGSLQVHFC